MNFSSEICSYVKETLGEKLVCTFLMISARPNVLSSEGVGCGVQRESSAPYYSVSQCHPENDVGTLLHQKSMTRGIMAHDCSLTEFSSVLPFRVCCSDKEDNGQQNSSMRRMW